MKVSFNHELLGYAKKIETIREELESAGSAAEDKDTKKALAESAHLVRTISINFGKIVDSDRVLEDMIKYGQEGVERIKKVIEAMYNLPKDMGDGIEAIDVTGLIAESFNFVHYQTYWENLTGTPKEEDISENLPRVAGYRSKLVSVFSNLIINAYQAMTDAGLSSADKRGIKIKAHISEDDPKFIDRHFANKGPLIPEGHIDSIFDQGFTTKKTGSGLGLNISKIQVEVFNKGNISVKNVEGFGPEFIVRLPVWNEVIHGQERREEDKDDKDINS
jgi:signal transduction histidine kinase